MIKVNVYLLFWYLTMINVLFYLSHLNEVECFDEETDKVHDKHDHKVRTIYLWTLVNLEPYFRHKY